MTGGGFDPITGVYWSHRWEDIDADIVGEVEDGDVYSANSASGRRFRLRGAVISLARTFLNSTCIIDPDAKVHGEDLFRAWHKLWLESGASNCRRQEFYSAVRHLFPIVSVNMSNGVDFSGIRLRTEADASLDDEIVERYQVNKHGKDRIAADLGIKVHRVDEILAAREIPIRSHSEARRATVAAKAQIIDPRPARAVHMNTVEHKTPKEIATLMNLDVSYICSWLRDNGVESPSVKKMKYIEEKTPQILALKAAGKSSRHIGGLVGLNNKTVDRVIARQASVSP